MKTVELNLDTRGNGKWSPVEGEETNQLIAHIGKKWTEKERENLRRSAARILGQCNPPEGGTARRTGLVVGYVQSGKTASFTSVTAMAVDNGYPLIIVLTGTKNNLQKQSADRLEDDLQLSARPKRKWRHFREPDRKEAVAIRQILDEYRDSDPDRQVALITLKKNWSILEKFINLLKGMPLGGVPVIIIDDEADQASLNTRAKQDDESPTYARILKLRNQFDNHTFLEYTATPQANLLISVLDVLSPQFAEIIEPGDDYVGGLEFFSGENERLVRNIPATELPDRNNPSTEVPASLEEAMRLYFIGVAAGYVSGHSESSNRTMFIHPARETALHGEFAFWVNQIRNRWLERLKEPEGDEDRSYLIKRFELSYRDIQESVGASIPDWNLLHPYLKKAIQRTTVDEVNSVNGTTDVIDWKGQYARIVVGGQALDRGVTLEGLTVTYMPRSIGTGAADTLQQRARFFGYKRNYLGYCRLYLDVTVRDAFEEYVQHERSLRSELDKLRQKGTPVTDWRRVFILSPTLQPTRRNVLSLKHVQSSFGDQWYWTRSPHVSPDAVNANATVLSNFRNAHSFSNLPDDLYKSKVASRHGALIGVSLRQVLEDLLVRMAVPDPDDNQLFTGLCFQISQYLENARTDELCDVYDMHPLDSGEDSIRAVDKDDRIENIFQGPNRKEGDPSFYPGDRALHAPDRITIQLRTLSLRKDRVVFAEGIPVLALWVPEHMRKYWLVQEAQN